MVGTHLNGGVVGGWTANSSVQATGINSTNGTSADADIDAEETLAAYYRTIMDAAGVPSGQARIEIANGNRSRIDNRLAQSSVDSSMHSV